MVRETGSKGGERRALAWPKEVFSGTAGHDRGRSSLMANPPARESGSPPGPGAAARGARMPLWALRPPLPVGSVNGILAVARTASYAAVEELRFSTARYRHERVPVSIEHPECLTNGARLKTASLPTLALKIDRNSILNILIDYGSNPPLALQELPQ